MKKRLDDSAIDALTAIDLPDRNMLSDCGGIFVIWLDALNNWNVDSFNSYQEAINYCTQINGNVVQVGTYDPTQTVDPTNTGGLFDSIANPISISDPSTIIQTATTNTDNALGCQIDMSAGAGGNLTNSRNRSALALPAISVACANSCVPPSCRASVKGAR